IPERKCAGLRPPCPHLSTFVDFAGLRGTGHGYNGQGQRARGVKPRLAVTLARRPPLRALSVLGPVNELVNRRTGRRSLAHHLQAHDAFGDRSLFGGARFVGDGIERAAGGTKELLSLRYGSSQRHFAPPLKSATAD